MRSERAAETIVPAPLDECLAVILDIEGYPRWVRSYRAARVEETDGAGRPVIASYEAGGFGMTARYRLAYSYAQDPVTVAFEQLEGDLTRSITGRYELRPEGEGTRVAYLAAVELAVPAPGLVRRAAERIVMETALRGLEGEVRRRATR